MKHLLHIFLLALTAFFGASCQDVPAYSGLQTRQEVLVQKENNRDCVVRTDGGIRFREGTLTSTPSLCRTICPSEERVQPVRESAHLPHSVVEAKLLWLAVHHVLPFIKSLADSRSEPLCPSAPMPLA